MGVNRYIRRPGATPPAEEAPKPRAPVAARDLTPIKAEIRSRVLDEQLADPAFAELVKAKPERAKRDLAVVVERLMDEYSLGVEDRKSVLGYIIDNIFGFGPLEDLLRDESITEIIVSGPRRVFVEQKGKLRPVPIVFEDNAHLDQIVQVILRPLNRPANESNPIVNGRLPDGSRVNVVMPPLAIDGISLNIRKFGKEKLTVEQLVEMGAMTREMADWLSRAVRARLNVLVSGGTGSGKTTLLNILSTFIPEHQHIVTIEDAAELQLRHPFIKRLEARPANLAGQGEVSIRDLVKNALRMRPDRIVVGECRGEEAFDMLTAMNTGHDGSLSTVHANSPLDTISRLETMILMAKELPIPAIRKQIASAVNLIVQTMRLSDGSRRVIEVAEVLGVGRDGEVIVDPIFRFERTGMGADGRFTGEYVRLKNPAACEERVRLELGE
ncbi:MAG TPA: CpaF family protein [Candidatus Dormibacteraeota bacterium]|jgi:pilus assembly protein CpaF|nr:CpaF family protein [Candidatus Dormibacteraeota bacterium]